MSDGLPLSTFRAAACTFYQRLPAEGGGWHYQPLTFHAPRLGSLLTTFPPMVGDLIHFDAGSYRVVTRSWEYPSYGSLDWSPGHAPEPAGLTLIVEDAEGPFVAEVEGDRS